MKKSGALSLIAAGAAAATALVVSRYRRDLADRRSATSRWSKTALTESGPVQYAELGRGPALLSVHGAGGGWDQGLLIARELTNGFRIIAPSRFGYLATPAPDDASIAAQADAHAALLDHLQIAKAVVMGMSAGAPSAIELALRHPERVAALILLVPRTYDPTGSVGVDGAIQSRAVLRMVQSAADFPFWLATHIARGALVRFLGVPPDLEGRAGARERHRVTDFLRSIMPLSERIEGIRLDSTGSPGPWTLDRVTAPTLIVSAEDDLFRTLPGARYTADGIPGAQLVVLASGGHLMLGQEQHVRDVIENFLNETSSGLESRSHAPQPDGTIDAPA